MTFRDCSTALRSSARLALFALALVAQPVQADGRVALLIGNNAYPSSPLRNAVNDAQDLGAALRELNFRTIVKQDVSRAQMIAALQEFAKALEGADAALFFYAGHAMQFKDRNYLIPVDAVMASEDDVTFFAVDVSQVLDRMERAKTRFNFVILDACRDNPFRDSFKVTASGLAQMSGPSGSLIAYATAPGATAADGFGRNGIYTGQILQNIKVPDIPVEVMFRKVREGVERDTKRLQTPWELSSIKGDFVFNSTRSTAASAVSSATSADTTAQLELQFWKSVEGSSRADDIQAYLDKYPEGVYSRLAKNRLDALLGRVQAAATTPAPAPSAAPTAPSAAPTAPSAASSAATAAGGALQSGAAAARPPPARELSARAPAAPAPDQRPLSIEPPTGDVVGKGARDAVAAPAPPTPRNEATGREIAPGVRELVFADGSVYQGEMRGSQLHGKGEYKSQTFRYQGDFKDGLKHGKGVYTWPNGDRYEGEFAADRPNGRGRWLFANGDVYEGEVKTGVITGRGSYKSRSGDRIEGSFIDGVAEGAGTMFLANGDRYDGEMHRGARIGKGVYTSRNGDRIEGSFVDGLSEGNGKMFFANGDRYEGEMRRGALTGQGVYFYSNGGKYQGAMVGGQPQGRGTYFYPDGARFEGSFEKGLARAIGTVYRADGTQNKAEIVDGAVRLLDSN